MNTRKLITALTIVASAAVLWSCGDDKGTVIPETPQENLLANNILIGSNSALNRVRGNGFGGPIGAIYGNFSAGSGRSAGTPLTMMNNMATSARSESDSTDTDDYYDHELPECVTETWEEDGNGNYTYTLDFGDGCDYYGEFMMGKLVEQGTYSDNSFSSTVTYTEFGSGDWSIDGTYSYSGTWEDNSSNLPVEPDSTDWEDYTYEATYEFTADLTEMYTDYGYPEDSTQASTGETQVTVEYEANGSETMNESGYTVESRTESVSSSYGESYTSTVDSPLYYDYECEDAWIYVSGVESGSYTYEDISGNYSIDYGDGTCDNIIVITENGISEEIDLDDEWDEWEEECGEDHGDD